MGDFKSCKVCGVPVRIGKDQTWNSDGTITQRRDPDHRMLFFDSEGLDVLFHNIENLIGVPIENMVIESKARATETYIRHLLRGLKGPLARLTGIGRIVSRVVEQGRVMGYGDIKVTEFNWAESRMVCDIRDPYSLPLFCGDLKGANQAIRKVAGTISYEEVEPGLYRIVNYNAPHAPELEQRLQPRPLPRKPGDITFDLCPGCGVPREIARFKWDLLRGTIMQEPTGVRHAIFGSTGLQVIFDELEAELGESIPETVVEAQRMHMESRMDGRWSSLGADDLRNWLAVQGLGNLVKATRDEGGMYARVENPAVPLILTGTAAALYQFLTGRRGETTWKLSPDGDLEIWIKATG
jgi:hypothetical protein